MSPFFFLYFLFQVRSWKDDRHSVAYDMQAVENFNEVTMHALEIIYTHMFNTKGPLPGKGSVGGGAAIAQPMHVSVGLALLFLLKLETLWAGPFVPRYKKGGRGEKESMGDGERGK